jgi:Helix-turn-helix domain
MTKSQSDQILDYLKRGRSINPLTALRLFGSYRLAARIRDLRARGVEIDTKMQKTRNGQTFARYSLA